MNIARDEVTGYQFEMITPKGIVELEGDFTYDITGRFSDQQDPDELNVVILDLTGFRINHDCRSVECIPPDAWIKAFKADVRECDAIKETWLHHQNSLA